WGGDRGSLEAAQPACVNHHPRLPLVLLHRQRVVRGLLLGVYAPGSTMAAPSGEVYPGGGNPIGTSVLFSHLAAEHMAVWARRAVRLRPRDGGHAMEPWRRWGRWPT